MDYLAGNISHQEAQAQLDYIGDIWPDTEHITLEAVE
jgi:hypothetical protein